MAGEAQAEQEPAVAEELFGDRIEVARRLFADLVARGEELGLIGPLELPRLWTRHIVNSALLAPLVSGSVADVGSGAGFPGLVLAVARPDVEFSLIEPMERRIAWLTAERDRLGLHNVQIVHARAEEAPAASFDQVTARAVAALSKLLPLTVPLLRRGGELILMKGAAVHDEVRKAERVISRLRLVDVRVEELGAGMATEVTRVFRARVS